MPVQKEKSNSVKEIISIKRKSQGSLPRLSPHHQIIVVKVRIVMNATVNPPYIIIAGIK